jgi:hypothetical protein
MRRPAAGPPTPLRSGRDDKGEGSAHFSSRYEEWTEPQVIRDFHPFWVGLTAELEL